LTGPARYAREQLLRVSQSIPLNIAEGGRKLPSPDRQRFLRIARGLALECSAILDILNTCGVATQRRLALFMQNLAAHHPQNLN
jgi:four helix bundle protein